MVIDLYDQPVTRWLKAGKKAFRVHMAPAIKKDGKENARTIQFKFNYHGSPEWFLLKDEIKQLAGSRWDPDTKSWLASVDPHNLYRLNFLDADLETPQLDRYYQPAPERKMTRPQSAPHQHMLFSESLHKRRVLLAAEMGTGKTLVAIELFEKINPVWGWYVAPHMALIEVKKQFREWKAGYIPSFFTYDEVERLVQDWPTGRLTPDMILLDESAMCKTPNTWRSKRIQYLTDHMRIEHPDPVIVELCGAPAPKDPTDWWKQCHIAQPGILPFGSPAKLKRFCSLSTQEQKREGGVFPRHITWYDDPAKCEVCGQYADHQNHGTVQVMQRPEMKAILGNFRNLGPAVIVPTDAAKVQESVENRRGIEIDLNASKQKLADMGMKVNMASYNTPPHTFKPSENRVHALNAKMKGLVHVVRFADVTGLPAKKYRVIRIKPSPLLLKAARMICQTESRVITALNRCRALSDGFQYTTQNVNGEKTLCRLCGGRGTMPDYQDGMTEKPKQITCERCGGEGEELTSTRVTKRSVCPKDTVFKQLLRENNDIGRMVAYAGYTASIDRVAELAVEEGWSVIQANGATHGMPYNCKFIGLPENNPLDMFQDKSREIEKILFLGHPATAKTSLTLTEACMTVYYSNTFTGDDRIQSEARIHRYGMSIELGATIVDLLHLPTDEYVLSNLIRKRDLLNLAMGEFSSALGDLFVERDDYDFIAA